MTIDIISDNSLIIPDYSIDFQNKTKKTIEKIEFFSKLKNLEVSTNIKKIPKIINKKNNFKKKKFYKKKFYKKAV